MKLTQRTLIIGAVLAALLVVLALQTVDPVFVVLVLAVLALVGLVAWGRVRSRERSDEEADWASGGDEWGLSTGEEDEDGGDYVDVSDRLAGFGTSDRGMPNRRGLFADDQFEAEEEVAWDEQQPEGVASYADDTFEEEFEELVEEYGTTEDEVALEVEYEEYEEYEPEPEPEPVRQTASIFAAPGVIDEEALDTDDAILAASEATRLQYDDVLTREDANAETREILSKVASLLAKYE